MKDFYKYGGWIYKLENGNHVVESPLQIPDTVYKYYNYNKFSREALLGNYLFCSHPFHLNDSMDCSNELWDFSELSENGYNAFFNRDDCKHLRDDNIDYHTDKQNNFEYFKTIAWNIFTNEYGLISLSEKPLHTLMWAHYATEKGFMIEFDILNLIGEFKKYNPLIKNYVFAPIQYVENLESINFFDKNFNSPDVPFLYSNNVKKSDWSYENEWRLICYAKYYGVPTSIMLPTEDMKGTLERHFNYDIQHIKSITLGKYFFNGTNLSEFKYPDIYTLKNDYDIEFFNYLVSNFNDRLYFSNDYEIDRKFERNRFKVYFERIDENKFSMKMA